VDWGTCAAAARAVGTRSSLLRLKSTYEGLNTRSMHGILLVDKPEGITSNDLVRIVKRRVRPAKVGHSGTLDSAATGLMVVLIGAATRALDYLDESHKRYQMTVVLGEETDSGDKEGSIVRTGDISQLTEERIREALITYRGVMDQVPPHYSAIKKDGVPLYRLARKGIFPEISSRKIEIFSLELKSWASPLLELDMVCSKGTYARAVARDLGNDLGVGGRLERLRRTASGPFLIENAARADAIDAGGIRTIEERLISLSSALAHIPDLRLLPAETRRLMRGSQVTLPRNRVPITGAADAAPARMFKVVSAAGNLVILVKISAAERDVSVRPVRVFNALEIDSRPESSEAETRD
jgi:tRNA pseudouridine55 synthase